ncbi:MAG: hypothetical protein ACRDCA_19075 [Serratia sp. (in: enterobacteria)]|uniref:hypothetical protein n=1 Tax=Serratia sp. (in: enterobacteria) TaxID=616 RepID=UPI003F2E9B35
MKKKNILLLHNGDFAAAVVDKFAERIMNSERLNWQYSIVSVNDGLLEIPQSLSDFEHVIVSSQTELFELNTTLYQRLRKCSVWLHFVLLLENSLFLGPNFRLDSPGCYECFRHRRMTHLMDSNLASWEKTIERHLAADPSKGVSGYPPLFPSMAVEHLLKVIAKPDPYINQAFYVSAVTHSINTSDILPLHGCQCRNNEVDAERYYRRLQSLCSQPDKAQPTA